MGSIKKYKLLAIILGSVLLLTLVVGGLSFKKQMSKYISLSAQYEEDKELEALSMYYNNESNFDMKGSVNPALRFRNMTTGDVIWYFDHDGKILAYNATYSGNLSANELFVGSNRVGIWLYNETIIANAYTDANSIILNSNISSANSSMAAYVMSVNNSAAAYTRAVNATMNSFVRGASANLQTNITGYNTSAGSYALNKINVSAGAYTLAVNATARAYTLAVNGSMAVAVRYAYNESLTLTNRGRINDSSLNLTNLNVSNSITARNLIWVESSSTVGDDVAIAGQTTVSSAGAGGIAIRGESIADADSGGAGIAGFASGGALNVGVLGCNTSVTLCNLPTAGTFGIYSKGNTYIDGNLNVTKNITVAESLIFTGDGKIVSKGSPTGSYGSLDINGSEGGYAGIRFNDVTGSGKILMVHSTANIQGFYDDAGWSWYFQNGNLTAGVVPVARVTAGTMGGSGYLTLPSGLNVGNGVYLQEGGTSFADVDYGGGDNTFKFLRSVDLASGYSYYYNGGCIAGACISDETVKTNILSITNSSEKLLRLKPSTYNFIDEKYGLTNTTSYGLMVQDVEKVYPDWVVNKTIITYKKDSKSPTIYFNETTNETITIPREIESTEEVKAIIYGQNLNMEMLSAINEHTTTIKSLQQEINVLKAELCNFESKYSWCKSS